MRNFRNVPNASFSPCGRIILVGIELVPPPVVMYRLSGKTATQLGRSPLLASPIPPLVATN